MRNAPTEQTATEKVIYVYADPLTGGTQEVNKIGTPAGSIKAREEYEPLGQSVRTTATVVVDPPGSSPPPLTNDARYPEWQCALPLQLVPSHCGLQILADETFVLGGIGSNRKEGNPHNIAREPARPHGDAAGMPVNPVPTTKPPTETITGSPVLETSLPDDDGDIIYRNTNETSYVTVRGGPSLPVDFQDASIGLSSYVNFGKKDFQWTKDSLISGARTVIENELKNPKGDCAKLLGKKALEQFDKISKNIVVDGSVLAGPPTEGGRATTLGENPTLNAVTDGEDIYLNPNGLAFQNLEKTYPGDGRNKKFRENILKKFTDAGAANQLEYATALIIHEFLHAIGKFKNDVFIDSSGKVDSTKSQENQEKVLKNCFSKK